MYAVIKINRLVLDLKKIEKVQIFNQASKLMLIVNSYTFIYIAMRKF